MHRGDAVVAFTIRGGESDATLLFSLSEKILIFVVVLVVCVFTVTFFITSLSIIFQVYCGIYTRILVYIILY